MLFKLRLDAFLNEFLFYTYWNNSFRIILTKILLYIIPGYIFIYEISYKKFLKQITTFLSPFLSELLALTFSHSKSLSAWPRICCCFKPASLSFPWFLFKLLTPIFLSFFFFKQDHVRRAEKGHFFSHHLRRGGAGIHVGVCHVHQESQASGCTPDTYFSSVEILCRRNKHIRTAT